MEREVMKGTDRVMTLKEAKDCVHNKYPKAVAIYSARHNGTFIRETRYILSRIIGPHIAAESAIEAWKETALIVYEGRENATT
jgi:hypothetical protein